jgi:sugar lactone lactonase YvrE
MGLEIIHEAQATLGEDPAWDAKTDTLYWVDILDKRVYFHRPDEAGFIQLDEMPGCLAPCKDNTLILAARASIPKLEPASATTTVAASITEPAYNRFNDGKCDPAGRFLVCTMDMDEKAPSGALYSFDGSQVTRLLDDIRISNGLGWSPDKKTFYLTSIRPRAKSKPSTMTWEPVR